ncbi:MAG: GH39 family glycosyl hydrolase, partial [Atribacterota bacterium]
LNDDMGVYKKTGGTEQFNFFNMDSIFDFLINIKMRPFVELSFMPGDMASGPDTVFEYKGNITPPLDCDKWNSLIKKLLVHLKQRYKAGEVSRWYFEVWNEPNLKNFWTGSKKDYFNLYAETANTIKDINPDFKVGGPATAKSEWISEFKQYCLKNSVPVDFISTHQYPTDSAIGYEGGLEQEIKKSDPDIMKKMAQKAGREAGGLPLFYTEWNSSPFSRDEYHDTSYCASFAAKVICDNIGLVDVYSFWTFSDIFEEFGFSHIPFHGGFGLLNIYGIPKPVFRTFEILNSMKKERIKVFEEKKGSKSCGILATKDKNELKILCYNHPSPMGNISKEKIILNIKGNCFKKAEIERIDKNHCNPRKKWIEMGSPEYLGNKETRDLEKESEIKKEILIGEHKSGGTRYCFDIPAFGVVGITVNLKSRGN